MSCGIGAGGLASVGGDNRLTRFGGALFAACLWLAASVPALSPALAQAPPAPAVPNVVIPPSEQLGQERQRFTEPPTPRAEPAGPRISLPSTTAPPGAEKVLLTIRDVRIDGATVYTKDQLQPLYAGVIGHEITLQAVYDLAQRITAKYGADGYVLSRAIVPPQNLARRGATLRIQVIEGYVDKVAWPASLDRFRDYFSHYAAKIIADRPVNVRTIERYLLLAGDLPGLKFSSSLKASEKNPNAATLLVEVVYKPVDATAHIDNRGTAARGPFQYLASATLNNPFGQQDALTVTYADTVPTKELNYIAGTYRQVLTSEGLAAFVNASDGFGKPGTAPLETIDFKTQTLYFDTGLSYPVIRSREQNLTVTGLFFASDSKSDANPSPCPSPVCSDDRLRGVRLRADVDYADAWRGINLLYVTFSQGIDGLGSTGNDNPMPSIMGGRVDFTKVEALASRTQPLFDAFSAYLAAYGQYAADPLLTPEQCAYGGRFFGRAYDPAALLGDSCIMGNAELRYDFAPLPAFQLSQVQLYGFVDGANLFDRLAVAGFPQNMHAASAGGGLRLGWLSYVNADFTVAKAIEGPRDDTRFFFSLTGRY
jgi:hemolysin activation/secretion protein